MEMVKIVKIVNEFRIVNKTATVLYETIVQGSSPVIL